MDWNSHMRMKFFITNLGTVPENLTVDGVKMGRYAVWAPITNSESHQIVEVGDDLETLVQKYHVTNDRICTVIHE